jgi:hypothetical protein
MLVSKNIRRRRNDALAWCPWVFGSSTQHKIDEKDPIGSNGRAQNALARRECPLGKVILEQFGRLDTRAHFPPPRKQNEMEKGNAGELGAKAANPFATMSWQSQLTHSNCFIAKLPVQKGRRRSLPPVIRTRGGRLIFSNMHDFALARSAGRIWGAEAQGTARLPLPIPNRSW